MPLTNEAALAQEHRAEAFRREAFDIAAAPFRGVHMSGFEPTAPRLRTQSQIQDAAAQRVAAARAFDASPRGRFVAALRDLEELYPAEVNRARAAYNRGFADARQPADPAEVGEAISALVEVDVPDARTAIAAMAELLQAKAA